MVVAAGSGTGYSSLSTVSKALALGVGDNLEWDSNPMCSEKGI